MSRRGRTACLALAAAMAAALAGCDVESADAKAATITVWDYYGDSTPIKPALEGFKRAHPEITVRYRPREYDDIQTEFPAQAAEGTGPDVSTLDMTWLSSLAADGLLTDLAKVSGGEINGRKFEHTYSSAALQAMDHDGRYVAAAYDFDTFALYYRTDLFEAEKITAPKTFTQLREAARKLADAADANGQKGKSRIMIGPDTFHFAQLLFQNGGDFLTKDGGRAAFAGPEGVRALTAYRDLLRDGGLYWGPEQSDSFGLTGIKDGRIAMFISGPYMMGVLRKGAPEQAGKWGVAPMPTDGKPGSYLGGTGLGIPAKSKNKRAAWTFVEYMLRKEQQIGVLKHAGAAPTTNEAVLDAHLSDADPYFGGEPPFLIFLEAVSTAKHLPQVKQWSQIDAIVNQAVEAALKDKKTPEQALQDAAKEVDNLLTG